MAVQHLSSAPSAPASPRAEASRPYRQAPSGYGKRSAPDQRPTSAADFACLLARERYVAGYVDHLPEGAAMDIKSPTPPTARAQRVLRKFPGSGSRISRPPLTPGP